MTPLPLPLRPPSPASLGPRRPFLQEEEAGFLGNDWWGMGERGEGWYSCWGGLRGSICHPGCPVNYSAPVRTDSLPSLPSSSKTFLLFPLRQALLGLCLGGLHPAEGLCPQAAHFWVSPSLSFFIITYSFSLAPLRRCLAAASLPTTVLKAQMWKPILRGVK